MASTPPPVTQSVPNVAIATTALSLAQRPVVATPPPVPFAGTLSAEAIRQQAANNEAIFSVAARELSQAIQVSGLSPWDGHRAGPCELCWTAPFAAAPTHHQLPAVDRPMVLAQLGDLADAVAEFAANNEEVVFANSVALMPNVVLGAALGISQSGRRFTLALMDTVMLLAGSLVHDLKDRFNLPRPNDVTWGASAISAPLVPTPSFSSYPGGHALQLETLHRMLDHVAGANALFNRGLLNQLTSDLIDHRRKAGLHTALDNQVGHAAGAWLAEHLQAAANQAGAFPRWAALVELARSEW